jgi:nucleotide-binding universal stress UspA family protein
VADSLHRIGEQFLDFADELAKAQGVAARKILRKGLVLDKLIQVAQEKKADLLVLGHEPRTFFEKALFDGSVVGHIEELKKQTGAK